MRLSQLFSQTLRETPGNVEVDSHRLLLQAGYILPLAAGIFSYLPLARRVLNKIEAIMREEINAIGGQEITMPVVHPAELWKMSGRWYKVGTEMGRFRDKNGRDMVLAMTHEEVVADLVRNIVRSYRQLPALIYHIQTKWRDDPRPRAGTIRAREFTMKDSYSLDRDWDGLERQYNAHYQAYMKIFDRCGLPVRAFAADVGMMGGTMAHEFMYLTPMGEDALLICNSCGYAANRQIARFKKSFLQDEEPRDIEPVHTPGTKTIQALAEYLGIPESKTAKAIFLMATFSDGTETNERLIFAVLRGDMELNEIKLANLLNARDLRPAREEEILAAGAVPGFASPVGLEGVLVVVDDLIPRSPNLVAGANRENYHLMNVNYGRDYQAQLIGDIAAAESDSPCPDCGGLMDLQRGVEVGHIFKLGTHFSESIGCYFTDEDGTEKPVVMGSYGIGSGRLMACIAEEHHDDQGLAWPASVAPFSVHLVVLDGKTNGSDPAPREIADRLYGELIETGIEVLYDDRRESPGVKFNDADLIGIPIRLTVSDRSLKAGGVEKKLRTRPEKTILSPDDLKTHLKTIGG
jgi:prolyl-tRNA synthetase